MRNVTFMRMLFVQLRIAALRQLLGERLAAGPSGRSSRAVATGAGGTTRTGAWETGRGWRIDHIRHSMRPAAGLRHGLPHRQGPAGQPPAQRPRPGGREPGLSRTIHQEPPGRRWRGFRPEPPIVRA
jgi:hypothetical protein